jgi:23S rRNA pseudouridine2604 synthase
MTVSNTLRLNKFISQHGICSRREADKLIEQGQVYINKRRAKVGDRVAPNDTVQVKGQTLYAEQKDDLIFIALNKPRGVVSTTDPDEPNNIIDYLKYTQRIFPIGRLDKDSQGLILLTNQGDMVNKILRSGNQHEKEYRVTVNKALTDSFIKDMSQGVPILGVTTKKCAVKLINSNTFSITLVQGLNRQIRRMCEHFGYTVLELERTRVMNISTKGIGIGEWRDLTPSELKVIYAHTADSKSHSQNKPKTSQKKKTWRPSSPNTTGKKMRRKKR